VGDHDACDLRVTMSPPGSARAHRGVRWCASRDSAL
jgi:hypothetical protein